MAIVYFCHPFALDSFLSLLGILVIGMTIQVHSMIEPKTLVLSKFSIERQVLLLICNIAVLQTALVI